MSLSIEQAGFTTILRQPDFVIGATENTIFRFEERQHWNSSPVEWKFIKENNDGKIIIYPSKEPVKFLKLRWNGDLSQTESVLGDEWGRISATYAPVEWRSIMPCRPLPWFCVIRNKNNVACYGVKTGCDCFSFFQIDWHGITLFLNLLSGAQGTLIQEPLTACIVKETLNIDNETTYQTVRRFMTMLCDKPKLPKEPIFGVNNWYWAYGNISREIIIQEVDYLKEMTAGVKHRPCLVIDDGWEINRTTKPHYYNGGPFSSANSKFGDMSHVSEIIRSKGAKPGIWFRPLLTLGDIPEDAKLRQYANGIIMDPSHPYTLERVTEDTSRLRDWGYEIIKHDFSGNDALGADSFPAKYYMSKMVADGKCFVDNTKTTATILKNLYKAIQKGAGESDVIGCGVFGHLSAGIHSIHRVGTDTSGRSTEWTIRNGVHSFMRLPMNNTFIRIDPDCAVFTQEVDFSTNFHFLELCALTGVATFASVPPNAFSEKELSRINSIFAVADQMDNPYEIVNYEYSAIPEVFSSREGDIRRFNWSEAYNGSRIDLTWML